MLNLRGLFQTFLLALIVALASNGVVMASSGVMHQEHCVQASADEAQTAHNSAHSAVDHANHDAATGDTALDHDHETCMTHACSAVAYDAHGSVAIPMSLSAATASIAHELVALERAESLLRPPNT